MLSKCIIAKLPASWKNFATSLKHKREDISTENLIIALNVEEKEKAEDAPSTPTDAENRASANVVVGKKNYYNKNKGEMQADGKPKKTTNFKKRNRGKDNMACFVRCKEGRLGKDCCYHKTNSNGQQKKVLNVTIGKNISDEADPSGYGNLPFIFLAIDLRIGGVIQVQMFTYVLISLCFRLTRRHSPPPS
jgi:hypothetical protein